MKTGPVALVLGAAVALGGLTGAVLLPERGASVAGTTPAKSPSSPPSVIAAAVGPITTANRLTSPDLSRLMVGASLVEKRDATPEALSACSAEARTLNDITRDNDLVLALAWTSADEQGVAQQIAAGEDAFRAENYYKQLLTSEEGCQDAPSGHWVYGPVRTEVTGSGFEGSWLGTYAGRLNLTGRAPENDNICGGVIVMHNGSRYGVVDVDICADAQQMAELTRVAVDRLG